ncbi:MAG TPA: HAD-IIB family hydrolase [Ignavibacteriales bacterium]|nr:HAD-IIB family hydrolase [Ignavibacteriales bacterium]
MQYYALATDYDGTLAKDGRVEGQTLEALKRFQASGRKLVLVTGRELDELMEVFPEHELFDLIVAENGALLYRPSAKEEKILGRVPPELFVSELHKRGVERMSVGRVIVATWRPFETTVLEVIRDLGLELQMIFNKDAVMVLPTGINKATGLKAGLKELGLSPHNVAAIGDAENDHAFLRLCQCSASVDNALPMLKETSDVVMRSGHGKGVCEFIDMILKDDLSGLEFGLKKNMISIGSESSGKEVLIRPAESLLLTGSSGSGKTTFASAFLEALEEKEYQYCIIDPEGDYIDFENAVILGSPKREPAIDEIVHVLENPEQNCIISLVGISVEHRPEFFEKLLPALLKIRTSTGRPHWIVIDEIHHLLPASWEPSHVAIPREFSGLMMVTIHPDHIAPEVLSIVTLVLAVGQNPQKAIKKFSSALKENLPSLPEEEPASGQAIAWWRTPPKEPFIFNPLTPSKERKRHSIKYAEGELPPERSFYFRGREGRLKLRAQNLMIFLQMAEGVDDETWLYHLKKGDYSYWFRNMIKDDVLAAEAEAVEKEKNISARESRRKIRAKVLSRYTAPE